MSIRPVVEKVLTRGRLVWVTVVIVLLFLSAGTFFAVQAGRYARDMIIEESYLSVLSLSHFMEHSIGNSGIIGKILSGSPFISAALIEKNAENIDKADLTLDRYAPEGSNTVAYIMDANGTVIASSNRHDNDSFVGENYAFRPYFKTAISGEPGYYFGKGVTSGKRGFYASFPVRGSSGIAGVAVIKKELVDVQAHIRRYEDCFFVHKSGVIFISSDPLLRFHALWRPSEPARQELLSSQQFGPGPFEPILEEKPEGNTIVRFAGKTRLLLVQELIPDEWYVYFFASAERVYVYRWVAIAVTLLLCSVIVGFSSVIYMMMSSAELLRIEQGRAFSQKERAELLFRLVPSGVFTVDNDRVVTSWNKKAEEITGYPAEYVLGKKCTFFTKSPCREMCGLFLDNIQKPISGEICTIITKEGEERTVSKNVELLKTHDGTVIGGIESFEDITQGKKMEEDLKKSESRLRFVFDSINEGIWDYSLVSGEMYLSPTWFRMLGYQPDELPRDYGTWMKLVHPEDVPEKEKALKDFIEGRSESFSVEIRMRAKNGEWRWMRSRAEDIEKDDKGRVARIIGTHTDITDRKKAEEEKIKALKVRSDFISVVSHELRTPLGPIREGASILLEGLVGDVNEQQKELLEMITRNADRLTRLINDVLDFQKLGLDKVEMDLRPNNINDCISETVESMSLLSNEKGLKLGVELDGGLPEIKFDKDKITQVLTNLINNAIKFTEEGGVKVRSGIMDNAVHVRVEDTGLGIRPEDIPKLFQSFHQLKGPNERKPGGTGLGLVICREIIKRHGGKIWAESEPGKGSVFHFLLPIEKERG
ncbi:MAG: PAS domain S-box protein [Candidatus Omnitrophica bacterium]|nr:PAS domain S-box protein [Candidatus Omnitrophota bacterium]MDD5487850.1 PAS domain S-box protein [Candidatus Omnitrophota bacterium]